MFKKLISKPLFSKQKEANESSNSSNLPSLAETEYTDENISKFPVEQAIEGNIDLIDFDDNQIVSNTDVDKSLDDIQFSFNYNKDAGEEADDVDIKDDNSVATSVHDSPSGVGSGIEKNIKTNTTIKNESSSSSSTSFGSSIYNKFKSTTTASSSSAVAAFASSGIIQDSSLVAIGKQITILEDQAKKQQVDYLNDFKNNKRPKMMKEILFLESVCVNLQDRINNEASKGAAYIDALELELNTTIDKLDEMKRIFFFPLSPIVLGQNGVYIAMDDIWLEKASSGHFTVELTPRTNRNQKNPEMVIVLAGSSSSNSSNNSNGSSSSNKNVTPTDGLTITLRMEGLKLAGEKGKNIPKLEWPVLDIVLVIKVSMVYNYDMDMTNNSNNNNNSSSTNNNSSSTNTSSGHVGTNKWCASPKQFHVEILSFKGPFGLSKSILKPILSLLTPILRKYILSILPVELGKWIQSLPNIVSLQGAFEVVGVDLKQLSEPFHLSSLVADMYDNDDKSGNSNSVNNKNNANYSENTKSNTRSPSSSSPLNVFHNIDPSDFELFISLQKSMSTERGSAKHMIKSVADVLVYKRLYGGGGNNDNNGNNSNNNSNSISISGSNGNNSTSTANNSSNSSSSSNTNSNSSKIWDSLMVLWEQAMRVYWMKLYPNEYSNNDSSNNNGVDDGIKRSASNIKNAFQCGLDKVLSNKNDNSSNNPNNVDNNDDIDQSPRQEQQTVFLTFHHLLLIATEVAKERMKITLNIKQLNGQFSLNQTIALSHQMFSRYAYEAANDGVDTHVMMENFQNNYEVATALMHYLSRKMDYIYLFFHANMMTSAKGYLQLNIKDISMQAPLSMKHLIAPMNDMSLIYSIGANHLIPFHTSVRPKKTGDIAVKLRQALLPAIATPSSSSSHLATSPFVTLNIKTPLVSLVASQSMKVKAGSELFTLSVGPKEKGWRMLQGSDADKNIREDDSDNDDESEKSEEGDNDDNGGSSDDDDDDDDSNNNNQHDCHNSNTATGITGLPKITTTPLPFLPLTTTTTTTNTALPKIPTRTLNHKKCPVYLQTNVGVKVNTQIPLTSVNIRLAELIRFGAAHFDDVKLLKSFLEKLYPDWEFLEDQLALGKIVLLESVAKYLLADGFTLDVNIRGKIVTQNKEIMITLETPPATAMMMMENDGVNMSNIDDSNNNKTKNTKTTATTNSAIYIQADFKLRDVMDDFMHLESSLKTVMNQYAAAAAAAVAALSQKNNSTDKKDSHKNPNNHHGSSAMHSLDSSPRQIPSIESSPDKLTTIVSTTTGAIAGITTTHAQSSSSSSSSSSSANAQNTNNTTTNNDDVYASLDDFVSNVYH